LRLPLPIAYVLGISGLTLGSSFTILKALVGRVSLRRGSFDMYIDRPVLVRSADGFWFFARPRTPDLYTIAVSERYELFKWFKPRAKGLIVDVGAYIGTYTVRACNQADLVVAVEPVPVNFEVLRINVELNCVRRNVVLVNRAVGDSGGKSRIYVPLSVSGGGGFSVASLKPHNINRSIVYEVVVDTLDSILDSMGLGGELIEYLKIDVEDYSQQAVRGALSTLKRTRYLQIELLRDELSTYRLLKSLGFRLLDKSGYNYLFRRE